MDLGQLGGIRTKLSLSGMGKPALFAVAAIIVMVAVLAGRHLLGAATTTEFAVEEASVASSPADDGSVQPKTVFVHVAGSVENPGLYEIESGSRLAAAIEAAGGFTEEARADGVNLARIVEDGEMIYVPSALDAGEDVASEAGAQQAPQAGGALVNINTASASDLETLPGIGPAIAERIVEDRSSNGAFKSVEDLKRVSGIGSKKYEAIADLVCV